MIISKENKHYKYCSEDYRTIKYWDATSRIFLERIYLPSLEGSVLYVGVGPYTAFYHKLVKNPELFETTDVLESVAQFGSLNKHYICDIRDLHTLCDKLFDHVCVFGILGHGPLAEPVSTIKTQLEAKEAFLNAEKFVKRGGTLLLGPGLKEVNQAFWDEFFYDYFERNQEYETIFKLKIGIDYFYWTKKL